MEKTVPPACMYAVLVLNLVGSCFAAVHVTNQSEVMAVEWYRAEIEGDGFMIDAGAALPDKKRVIYVFPASDDEEAEKKAKEFGHSLECYKEFWITRIRNITVTKYIGKEKPAKETAYLAT